MLHNLCYEGKKYKYIKQEVIGKSGSRFQSGQKRPKQQV